LITASKSKSGNKKTLLPVKKEFVLDSVLKTLAASHELGIRVPVFFFRLQLIFRLTVNSRA
jgi:hypothetical protein